MSISGLISKTFRSLRKSLKRLFALIPISKIKLDNDEEDQVPDQWVEKIDNSPRRIRKGQLSIKKGKIVVSNRKLYHVPWLRNIKRVLAVILLFINFAFTQFLLISTGGLQIVSLFFFLNCFILADYLWKTRRAPVED